ncbi:carbohydrate ABC transporter permease [Pacificibacter marinus]|uniref:carbohydrate ABC transporter permease n=1 Tax=Pacificibacter marinus TaxID=658057 RepID=UPI001C07E4B4|nr:sugar ABC transporter permease [Pacificibacter marinus]MBU2867634.1 sugar ABC transporter permease [Pacificibacter marinus]
MNKTSQAGTIQVPKDRMKRRRRQQRRGLVASYLFVLPYLCLLLMFGVIPVIYAFGMSFFDTISGVFWGITNYKMAFQDYRLEEAIYNIIGFVALWVSVTIIVVTGLSLMLDILSRRVATTIRTIYFLPGAITSSAIVVLWLFLVDPLVSPFQAVFHMFGWEARQHVVNGLGMVSLFAIMSFFAHSGGWIIVMGGALSGLSREVMEASRVDGANLWQQAVYVKLPMIWKSVALMGILTLAGGLQIFVEPQLMGMAGPQYARSDWSVNQLAFQYAFSMGDFGISAALSTMLITVSVTIALILIFATKFYQVK